MKHTLYKVFLAVTMLFMFMTPARADDLSPDTDWQVTFNGKALTDNFTKQEFVDVIRGMQPGDTATFQVHILNKYKTDIDWWYANNITKTFEENSIASDGAYSYRLTYQPTGGDLDVIYDSDIVGGEDDKTKETLGLHEATTAMKDFKFLDTLKANGTGVVTITVKLDGETQGNRYQDTIADLELRFAVELPDETVKTGDTSNSIYYVLAGVSGLVILLVLFLKTRNEKKEAGE